MFTDKEGIVTAIGVLILVIGAATGNAYAMLAMAAAGLVLCAILYRGSYKGGTGLVLLAATATAAVVAFAAGIALSGR
jgi:hypothetical protein